MMTNLLSRARRLALPVLVLGAAALVVRARFLSPVPALRLVVVLVDGRRGLADDERQLIDWLQHIHRDFIVAVTKVDKLSKPERGNALRAIRQATGATVVGVSGLEGDGREDLLRLIRTAVSPDDVAQSDSESGASGENPPGASPPG